MVASVKDLRKEIDVRKQRKIDITIESFGKIVIMPNWKRQGEI